jgi:hypothetical protein
LISERRVALDGLVEFELELLGALCCGATAPLVDDCW